MRVKHGCCVEVRRSLRAAIGQPAPVCMPCAQPRLPGGPSSRAARATAWQWKSVSGCRSILGRADASDASSIKTIQRSQASASPMNRRSPGSGISSAFDSPASFRHRSRRRCPSSPAQCRLPRTRARPRACRCRMHRASSRAARAVRRASKSPADSRTHCSVGRRRRCLPARDRARRPRTARDGREKAIRHQCRLGPPAPGRQAPRRRARAARPGGRSQDPACQCHGRGSEAASIRPWRSWARPRVAIPRNPRRKSVSRTLSPKARPRGSPPLTASAA